MLLLKLDENKYPVTETPLQQALQKRLEEGKISIFYQTNKEQDKIVYYGTDAFFASFKVIVSEDGNVNFEGYGTCSTTDNRKEQTNLNNTFLRYLIKKDKESSEEMLQRRYGRMFNDHVLYSNMSEEEIEQYKIDRIGFDELLENLKNDKEDSPESNNDYHLPKKSYSIRLDFDPKDMNGMEIQLFDKEKKKTIFSFFSSIYKYCYLDNPELFTPIQKDIFATLTPLYIENMTYDSFYHRDTNMTEEIIFRILPMLTKQEVLYVNPIRIKKQDYTLEKDIVPLKMEIDENGEIQTNFPQDCEYYICQSIKQILCVDKKNRTLAIYSYPNEKVRKLFCFKQEHPDFSSKMFIKDISTALVPKLKDEVAIESTFLSKSLMQVDHIDYYVDLDKDTMQLICKTNYCLDKKNSTKEEFMDRYQDKFQGFSCALEALSMKESGNIKDPDIIVNFVSAPLEELRKYAQLYISEDLKKLNKRPIGKINIAIASQNDWFSLDFSSDEYTKEEVDSILSAYKKKKRYFLLKGKILDLDEGQGNDIKEILDDIDFRSTKIPIYQALKLTDKKNVDLSEPIKELFNDIIHYDEKETNLDSKMQSILRPYQIKGVKWLSSLKEHHLSGILADDMGLGKTLEMIAFLSQYDEKKPNLIITPKSLTFNWEDEFHHWNKEAKVVVLSLDKEERHSLISQIKKDETVNYVISYDSLRIDLELFKDISFGFVILDEGQNIANALSQRARAVKSIEAEYKFALTGTPIQNSLMDLWSLFDFLMPGYLKSFNEFRKQYAKYDIDKKEREHLEHIVSPFLLKRKKDDVLKELPGKTIVTQSLVMDEKEKELYNAYLMKAKNTFQEKGEGGKTKKLEVLAALTRLRQICVDPSSFLEYDSLSSKLDYTIFLIKEAIAKGHKVLLFSSFKTVLLHLTDVFQKEKITYDSITGDTPAAARLSIAKRFNQEEDPKVMLISLKAGGTGLNLIGADIVVHLDPWWNVAAEDQASDRAYRIGQKRKVTIYKIVMKNTIEEKVLSLQEKKKNLSDIFDNASEKTNLNDEDIAYLLS